MPFDALEVSLQYLQKVAPVEAKIRKRSPELAKQLSRASDSMALNIAEGRSRKGGDQRYHYSVAEGSASEATAALRVALARGFITKADFGEADPLLDRMRAMLYRMAR